MAKTVKKKSEWPPKTGPVMAKGKSGSAAKLSRDSKGNLKATLKKDFAGVSQSTMAADRKVKAGTGDGSYNVPAPRVGGKQAPIAKSGQVSGGTKKMVKASKKRVSKSSASSQAKKSARRIY